MKEKPRKNLDEIIYGTEPTFDGKPFNFIECLSWYSRVKDYKDSKSYLMTHLKSNKYDSRTISKISSINEWEIKNLGYFVRMISRGYQPTLDQILWVEKRISDLCNYESPKVLKTEPATPKAPKPDRTYEKCSEIINTIEDAIDDRDYTLKVYEILTTEACKSTHIKQIVDHFKPLSSELTEVMLGKDDQLVEGYSNYTKTEMKKFNNFLKLILSDCAKFTSNARVIKTPRKKKVIPVSKKVMKLNYKKEDTEYKIVSVNPENIIGCKNLWVFNTKTRKLGVYISSDESGLGIKGSTIENYNTDLSVTKTVRKPLDIIPGVVKGNKTILKKVMSSINSVESLLNGRINADVVLLTIVK